MRRTSLGIGEHEDDIQRDWDKWRTFIRSGSMRTFLGNEDLHRNWEYEETFTGTWKHEAFIGNKEHRGWGT